MAAAPIPGLPLSREWMATGRSVNFRARLLPLAGAAIVVVLALGHDAALDQTRRTRPLSTAREKRIGVLAYRRIRHIVLDCSFITCNLAAE